MEEQKSKGEKKEENQEVLSQKPRHMKMSNAGFEQGQKRDVPILGSMDTRGALIHCFIESKAGSRVSVVSFPPWKCDRVLNGSPAQRSGCNSDVAIGWGRRKGERGKGTPAGSSGCALHLPHYRLELKVKCTWVEKRTEELPSTSINKTS